MRNAETNLLIIQGVALIGLIARQSWQYILERRKRKEAREEKMVDDVESDQQRRLREAEQFKNDLLAGALSKIDTINNKIPVIEAQLDIVIKMLMDMGKMKTDINAIGAKLRRSTDTQDENTTKL